MSATAGEPKFTSLSAAVKGSVDGSTFNTTITGTATISADNVVQGSSVNVSAPTISGYTFYRWYSSKGSFGSNTTASTTFTPTDNSAQAVARYKKQYTFSGTKNGTGDGTLTVPSGTKLAGDSLSISVAPNATSDLTAFTVNGVNKLSSVSSGTYNFTASFSTTTAIPVVATFTAKSYAITPSATHCTVTAAATAAYGSTVNFTVAGEDASYNIDSVTATYTDSSSVSHNVSVSGSNGSYSFTMPAGPVRITASASKTPHNVTVTKSTGVVSYVVDGVTYNASQVFSVSEGDPFTITSVTYSTGYEDSGNTLSIASVLDATTITLTGSKINYNVNKAAASNGSFTVTKNGSQITTANYGDTVVINPSPNPNYEIASVSYNDGSDHPVSLSGGTYSFTMPAHDVTVTVTFTETMHTVTVVSENASKGTVESGSVSAGGATWVTLPTATPASGYSFSTWEITSGSGGSLQSPTSSSAAKVKTTGNITVTARFVETMHTVTVTAQAQGSTSLGKVTPSSGSAGASTGFSATATAYNGYAFKNWTGSNLTFTPNSEATTITASDAGTATANFKPTVYYLDITNSSDYKVTGGRYAAYFWVSSNTSQNKWVDMTQVSNEDYIYKVTIPTDHSYDRVIFCRMNGGTTANNWDNRWNQTVDITIANPKNKYNVTEKNNNGNYTGSWDDNAYIADITYAVSITSGAGGSVEFTPVAGGTATTISAGNTTSVQIGSVAKTLVAKPADGYKFTGWTLSANVSIADSLTTASTTVTAEGTGIITASFARVTHAINIVSGATFTATASPASGYYGESSTISVSPNAGYRVTGVTATWAAGSKAGQSVTVTGSGNSCSLTIPAYGEESAINVTVSVEAITPVLNVYYANSAESHTNVTSGPASTSSTESETLTFSNAGSYPTSTPFQIIDGSTVLVSGTAGSATATTRTLDPGTHYLKVKATLDGVELTSETITFTVYESVNIILQQPSYGGVAKISYKDDYGATKENVSTAGTYPAAKGETVTVQKNSGAGTLYKVNVNGTDHNAAGSPMSYSFTINEESTVKALFRSDWQLPGSFNSWTGTSNYFVYTDTENVLQTEVNLSESQTTGYTFKVYNSNGSKWYSNTGTFTDRTEDSSGNHNWWTFNENSNSNQNCTIKTTTSGYYKFKWNTSNNNFKLQVDMPRKLHNITYTGDNLAQCSHTGNAQEAYKDDVTFTVTPNEGYRIESVTINGNVTEPTSVTNGVGTYTYRMVDSDITIDIDIYRISNLTVNINEGISQITAAVTAPNSHVTNYTFTTTGTIEVSQGSTVAYVASYEAYWGYGFHNDTAVTQQIDNDHNYSQTIAAGDNEFDLVAKILWRLKGSFSAPDAEVNSTAWKNSWYGNYDFTDNPATESNIKDGKVTLNLDARKTYKFKLFAGEKDGNDDKMYSNSGDIRHDTMGNPWTFAYKDSNNTVIQNCTLETTVAGAYTFYLDWSDSNIPKIQVEFPAQSITYTEQLEGGTATSTITHLTFNEDYHPTTDKYHASDSNGTADKTITIKVAAANTYKITGATYTYIQAGQTVTTTANATLTKPTVTNSTSAPYYYTITFTLPRDNVAVNIVYRKHDQQSLSYTVGNSGTKAGFSAVFTDSEGTAKTEFTIGETVYITATSPNEYYRVTNGNFNSTSSNSIKAKNSTFTAASNVYKKAFVITADTPSATVRFTLAAPTASPTAAYGTANAGKPLDVSSFFSFTATTDKTYWITTVSGNSTPAQANVYATNTTGSFTAPSGIGTYYVIVKAENKKHNADSVTFNNGELPSAVFACVELDVHYATLKINVYLEAHGNTLAEGATVSVVDDSGAPKPSDESGNLYRYPLTQNLSTNGSTSLYIKENMPIPDNGADVKVKITLAAADGSLQSETATISYSTYLAGASEDTPACDLWFEVTNPTKVELKAVEGNTTSTQVASDKQRIYIKKNKNWTYSGDWASLYIYAWKSGNGQFPSDGYGKAHDSGDNANKFHYITHSGDYYYYYFDLDKSFKDFLVMGYNGDFKGKTPDTKIGTSNCFILNNGTLTATDNAAVPDITSYYSSVQFNVSDGPQQIKPTVTEGATLTVKTPPDGTYVTYDNNTGMLTPVGASGDTSITFTVTGTAGDTREVTTSISVSNAEKPNHIYFMSYESSETTVTIPKLDTNSDSILDASPATFTANGVQTRLTGVKAGTAFDGAGIWTISNDDSGDKLNTVKIKYAKARASSDYSNIRLTATVAHTRAAENNYRRFGFKQWNNAADDSLYSNKSDAELVVGTDYKLIYEIYQYTEITITYNYYTYKTHRDDGEYNFYDTDCLAHESVGDSAFGNWHESKSYNAVYEYRGNDLNNADLTSEINSSNQEKLETAILKELRNITNEYYDYELPSDPVINVTDQDTSSYTLSINVTLKHTPKVYDVRVKSASSEVARINTVNGTYINPATATNDQKADLLYYQSQLELDYAKLSARSAATGLSSEANAEYKWSVCQEPWNATSPPTTGFMLMQIGNSYKFRVTTENMFIKVENKGNSDTVSKCDSIVSYMGHTLQKTTVSGTTSEKLYQNFYLVDHFDSSMEIDGVSDYSEVKFVGGGGIYYSVDPETGVPLKADITSQNIATETSGVYSLNKTKVADIILNRIRGEETDSAKVRQKFGTELPREAYKINNVSTGLVFKYTPYEKYDSTNKKYNKNTDVFRYSRVLGGYQYVYSLGMENEYKNRNKNLQFFSYYIYSYVTYSADEAITNYRVVISDNSSTVPTYVDSTH